MSKQPGHQLNATKVPRYAGYATFLRAPIVEEAGDVDIGLIGVPVDHSATIRPGTRSAPSAVRDMSRFLHPINATTKVSPFELVRIGDIGDAPVNALDYEKTLELIEEHFRILRDKHVVPVAIGGDHSVTLPILRGLFAGERFGIVIFDSHHDCQPELLGSRVNHGTSARRLVEEGLVDPARVIQVGLRGGYYSLAETKYGEELGIHQITMDQYEEMGRARVIDRILEVLGDEPAYVSIDIDGVDPSQAPATGLPEVGGLSVRDLQVILRSMTGRQIIGGDICEVSPPLDVANMTSIVAANLMMELTCLAAVTRAQSASLPPVGPYIGGK